MIHLFEFIKGDLVPGEEISGTERNIYRFIVTSKFIFLNQVVIETELIQKSY